ncbi:hypothetical protein [Paraburkholderia elongata]|uniref:Uncharacterized protein n=1 Tax=Paraburkholderia elongata TaxID=2675747 RepID=A0A972NWL1_9BURK|nr:hypothetical protein [Paraburkholderia elongata]NPT59132.1 hypothetical protein [Paraburkholderia elongata]
MKLAGLSASPLAAEHAKIGVIELPPTNAQRLRQIADSVTGDHAFILAGILRGAAEELERKFDIEAALAKLTRYDDVYRYGETVMLAVGEDNPRGSGEYVRFDDVREVLEGIDAARLAGKEGV